MRISVFLFQGPVEQEATSCCGDKEKKTDHSCRFLLILFNGDFHGVCQLSILFGADSYNSTADADRLNLGGSATLDFPQHYSGTVSATVFSKSEPDGSGKVAVVFACNNALADTLAMRKTTADVVYSEHTGLRVPLKAVHMDDDGQAFVYVVTAAQLEKKPIEIIYQTDDYCLVAQSTESNALRAGNEIVVTGKGLSNGQVVK